MAYQNKFFMRTWLSGALILTFAGACSFELPEKIQIKGSPALELPLGGYEYPKKGEKLIDLNMIKDSLGEDVAVYDYIKPGSTTQTFLVHYRQALDSFTFDPSEYSFTGTQADENFD
ncbi:MAG: hypothetical protein LBL28_01215, partial [Treponema sp.]|nr:hypothetical protein [Treponema sp.]